MSNGELAGPRKVACDRFPLNDTLHRVDRLVDERMETPGDIVAVGLRQIRKAFLVSRRQHAAVSAARSPTDVSRIENGDAEAGLGEVIGCREAGKATADHKHIGYKIGVQSRERR